MRTTPVVRAAALLLAAPMALAAAPGEESPEEQRRYLLRHWDSIHIDQDLFAPGFNEDRNYTMGVKLVWEGEKARRHWFNTSRALGRIDRALGLGHEDDAGRSVAWGNSAFTPDRLELSEVIDDDRPYSSLLYTTTSLLSDEGNTARSTQLTIGVLGLGISRWGQSKIHQVLRGGGETPYEPMGWHNQISHGGEPTFSYRASWLRHAWTSGIADFSYSRDVSVGYYTNASVGGVMRIGSFDQNHEWWRAIGNLDPQSDANKILRHGVVPEHAGHEVYFMLGARATWVGYNVLLQGQFRDSAFDLGNGDIERLVWEGSIGVNWTFPSKHRVWINCTQRSPEHKLAQRRAHTWCGLNYQTRL